MTFAQRQNRLTTRFPVVKRRISVFVYYAIKHFLNSYSAKLLDPLDDQRPLYMQKRWTLLFQPFNIMHELDGPVIRIASKYSCYSGPGSVVGIATGYGLDGPGIESRWGQDFPHLYRPTLGPTQPPVQWVPGLSRGVKSGRGVTLTPHPF